MKKYTLLVCTSLLYFTSIAQIKIDTKNLKKIKTAVESVSDNNNQKPENTNTNTNTAVVPPVQNNNAGNSQPVKTSTSAPAMDMAGWTQEELAKVIWTGAYLIDGGWMVDKMEFRKNYNEQMAAPVAEVSYWSYCYKVPLTVRIFRMEDKGLVTTYDFEAEAKKSGGKGYYSSQMVIADQDRYLLIFSYSEKVDANMDKYMEEKYRDLASRIPNSWK